MFTSKNKSGLGPVDTTQSPFTRLKTLNYKDVLFTDGFWTKKQTINRKASLFFAFKMLNRAGNFDNLRLAAGTIQGNFRGYVFQDSDIYKWLEALAWEMGREADRELSEMADQAIALIAAAQWPNGYINSYVQTRTPPQPWEDLDDGHELYCAGFLFQAAVAFQRALGDGRLLTIACRFADHIDSVFGLDKRQGACGHPVVEMALVELFRVTQNERYLKLAKFFIDQRGQNVMKGHRSYGPEYHQDHVPVRQVVEATGHAVRQLYLASGVTDLYLETGEQSLLEAMLNLSKDIIETKSYVTGGMGSRFDGEAFGDPYELPTDQCYCETCAAISSFMWNWRLLLITGDGRFADQMERVLYNNILASPDLDGQHYFYINPLMLREARYLRLSTDLPPSEVFIPNKRPEWHDCACCPPNVMRLFSSLTHYLATQNASGIQIHHYAAAEMACRLPGGSVKLSMMGNYPWQGEICVRVVESISLAWELSFRIPEWCQNVKLAINGNAIKDLKIEKGYLVLERLWQPNDEIVLDLEIAPVLVRSHPRVDATRGCLTIQRGPLVYCLEDKDQEINGRLLDVEIDPDQPLKSHWNKDLLGGVMVIEAQGQFLDCDPWARSLYRPLQWSLPSKVKPAVLKAIPYFTWGNRQIGGMRVWIPQKS